MDSAERKKTKPRFFRERGRHPDKPKSIIIAEV
jgi:hypothetical protein